MLNHQLCGVILAAFLAGCATHKPAAVERAASQAKIHHFQENFKNSPAAEKAPYVILVSLDGFRHDYAEKYKAKSLQDMAEQGTSAQSLIPVFPSKTFPNHYSIITGLYADEHGIVSNEFYDPTTKETYNAFKGGAREAKWYAGEPLWITAEKNGFVSASYFWVASEAPIEGQYPNYWVEFSELVPDLDRVHQVVAWLKLPASERPHFITLYFSGVDHAGHKFGTDSAETAHAVQHLDEVIGELRRELATVNLPIDLIVVSDHGMDNLSSDKIVGLDSVDLS
ncbi:MAG: alkaline phosphatase family protein, partial [Bdellovibrionales bacterium]